MKDRGWIVVPNWDRFQHYSDRNPVWIKLYTELSSRDDWRSLPMASRGLLVSLWLEYARSGGLIRVADCAARVRDRNTMRALKPLIQAGFIEISASKPLARSRARARERRSLKRSSEEGASARAKQSGSRSRPEEEERERAPDPEVLERLRMLTDDLFREL